MQSGDLPTTTPSDPPGPASLPERLRFHLGWLERVLPWLFKVLLLAVVFFHCFRPMELLPDGGWHLAQARWMYENWQPVTVNWFNYPLWGQPLVNEYAFYHLLIWPLWTLSPLAAGWLSATIAFTIVWLLFRLAREAGLHPVWFLFLVSVALISLQVRFSPRPEMIGYLALVLMTLLLWRSREAAFATPGEVFVRLWPLLVLQIAWVNSHSSFLLGPLLVALWGGELWVRRSWRDRRPDWLLARGWSLFGLAMATACLLTPQPLERLWVPFSHQGSRPILTYVTEMYPLSVGESPWFLLLLVVLTLLIYRGMSATYALLAVLFYYLTLVSGRHESMFALLALLAMISSGFYGQAAGWTRHWSLRAVGMTFCLLAWILPLALLSSYLSAASARNLGQVWSYQERDEDLVPRRALAWLERHGIKDRLLHRTEIGGELQLRGRAAQCLGDTGFGKYDARFIYQLCVLCERPGLLFQASEAFQAPFALVSNRAYAWPYALRQMGWRCVFFSPNGSVWAAPNALVMKPALTNEEIAQIWQRQIRRYGLPGDPRTRSWWILHLAAAGQEKLALRAMQTLPELDKTTDLYWQTARRLAFPRSPGKPNEGAVFALEADVAGIHDDVPASYESFEAAVLAHRHDSKEIIASYSQSPRAKLSSQVALALATAYLWMQRPESALEALNTTGAFAPNNGRRYWLLGQTYARLNQPEAAARAYAQALYLYPDDEHLQAEVREFLLQSPSPFLLESLKNALHVY
ncbi:MAG: tetratricopeptide repeat protein [Verrucomicrobiota bacterium]